MIYAQSGAPRVISIIADPSGKSGVLPDPQQPIPPVLSISRDPLGWVSSRQGMNCGSRFPHPRPDTLPKGSLEIETIAGGSASAGINRHGIGDERAPRERRSCSIMAPSHVRVVVRLHVKQLTGGNAGQPLSSEITHPGCRPCVTRGKATLLEGVIQRVLCRSRGVLDPVHAWTFYAREPGDLHSL